LGQQFCVPRAMQETAPAFASQQETPRPPGRLDRWPTGQCGPERRVPHPVPVERPCGQRSSRLTQDRPASRSCFHWHQNDRKPRARLSSYSISRWPREPEARLAGVATQRDYKGYLPVSGGVGVTRQRSDPSDCAGLVPRPAAGLAKQVGMGREVVEEVARPRAVKRFSRGRCCM
jgi:hypothetical protein